MLIIGIFVLLFIYMIIDVGQIPARRRMAASRPHIDKRKGNAPLEVALVNRYLLQGYDLDRAREFAKSVLEAYNIKATIPPHMFKDGFSVGTMALIRQDDRKTYLTFDSYDFGIRDYNYTTKELSDIALDISEII